MAAVARIGEITRLWLCSQYRMHIWMRGIFGGSVSVHIPSRHAYLTQYIMILQVRDDPWIKNMPSQLCNVGLGPCGELPRPHDYAPGQLVIAGFVYFRSNQVLKAALETSMLIHVLLCSKMNSNTSDVAIRKN